MEQAHSLDIQSQQPYTSVCLKHDRHPERLTASGRKFVLAVPALPGAVSVPTADSQEVCAWLLLCCAEKTSDTASLGLGCTLSY